jgi:hypothetical protein
VHPASWTIVQSTCSSGYWASTSWTRASTDCSLQ